MILTHVQGLSVQSTHPSTIFCLHFPEREREGGREDAASSLDKHCWEFADVISGDFSFYNTEVR